MSSGRVLDQSVRIHLRNALQAVSSSDETRTKQNIPYSIPFLTLQVRFLSVCPYGSHRPLQLFGAMIAARPLMQSSMVHK